MSHNDTVRQSFKKQAGKFTVYHMSKTEYTDYLIQKVAATGEEHTLEVAAGTCICGRALAPFVKDITCLDLTEEMLSEGKRLAKENQIDNIYFQLGNAEKLPYEAESFDLMITRLSFHHFAEPEIPFREMQRVLKTGGKLVIWDMEAVEEPLRVANDKIEKMRDPSHTRILSRGEFETMFQKDFTLQCEESTLVPVDLKNWMELTDTPEDVQKEIVDLMKDDLSGGRKTGFSPYIKGSRIMFNHRWLLLIGIKN